MSGIEFYPQKEFDEDIEDKSDNDKIRVSGSVLFCSHTIASLFVSFPPPFQTSLSQIPALFDPSRNSRHCGTFYLFLNH